MDADDLQIFRAKIIKYTQTKSLRRIVSATKAVE